MSASKLILGTILISLLGCKDPGSINAYAGATVGTVGGGGGKGVVCRDSDKKVISVQLLDLWEAENNYNYKLDIGGSATVEALVDKYLQKLKYVIHNSDMGQYTMTPDGSGGYIKGEELIGPDAFASSLKYEAHDFLSGHGVVEFVRDAKLELTDDSYETNKPADCAIEQIVNYEDYQGEGNRGRAWVDADLVDKMDNLNKAALYLHEAFYKVMRASPVTFFGNELNSIRIRRTIGYIFSGHEFTPFENLLPAESIKCFGNDPKSDNKINLFSFIFFGKVGGKTTAFTAKAHGSHAMGTYPVLAFDRPTPMLDSLLQGQKTCSGELLPEEGVVIGNKTGPVDYDKEWKYTYRVLCLDGKVKMFGSTVFPKDFSEADALKFYDRFECGRFEN